MDYKPLDHIKESLPPDINEKDCYLGGWELLPASKYNTQGSYKLGCNTYDGKIFCSRQH